MAVHFDFTQEVAMPLRVIDVERTIRNSQTGGIHFTRSPIWHVISHTWSADVREFSSIIGNRMKQRAAGTEMGQHDFEKGQIYKAGGFYRYPIYQKLVEFLIILHTKHQAIWHVISDTCSQIWHVISHTWSMNVCAFLCRSGVRQQEHTAVKTGQHAVKEGQIYEDLFEAAGFHNHPAYQKLIEFLIILQAEEVRWVWFDAVCINQTDAEEKDHEIQHMGTYYQRSVGCFVLQHGIGKGFELLLRSDDDNDDGVHKDGAQVAHLPRWFTRAWTLQEWVLPPKTTFIIDLTLEQWLCRIASIVLLRASGGCLCCLYESTLNPSLLRQCKLRYAEIYVKKHEREEDDLSLAMVKSTKTCQCSKPHDDPHFRKVPERRQWYFADDLGYSFLLRLKFHMHQIPDDWDTRYFSQKPMAHDAEFELTRRLGVKQAIKIGGSRHEPRVIREISMRDCSNPEDRVLSVLKLLGVQNAFQVRAGKSLDMQLLHLAKSLVDSSRSVQEQELLINLCLVDGFGNEAPGMSWMPQFEVQKGSWQEGARLLAPEFASQMTSFDAFKPEMRCNEVTNTGMLRIEADVCSGHLICDVDETLKKAGKEYRRADEVQRSMVLKVEGQVIISYIHAHMFKELEQRTTCILASASKNPPSGYSGNVCIALNGAAGLHCLRDRIPVWLVKVGCSDSSYMYWLVCVREEQGSSLHKIGYLYISLNMSTASLFSSSQKMHCFIGGLGHHSSKLLFTTEQRE